MYNTKLVKPEQLNSFDDLVKPDLAGNMGLKTRTAARRVQRRLPAGDSSQRIVTKLYGQNKTTMSSTGTDWWLSGIAPARVVVVPRLQRGALDRQRGGERVRELACRVHARRAAERRTRAGRRRCTAGAPTRRSTPTSTTSGKSGPTSPLISVFIMRSTHRWSGTPRRAARWRMTPRTTRFAWPDMATCRKRWA